MEPKLTLPGYRVTEEQILIYKDERITTAESDTLSHETIAYHHPPRNLALLTWL